MIVINNSNGKNERTDVSFQQIIKNEKKFKLKEIQTKDILQKEGLKNDNSASAKQLSNYCGKAGELKFNQLKLSRKGIMYRLNNFNLTVPQYYLMRLIFSLAAGIICFAVSKHIVYVMIAFIISFIGIDITFIELNEADNKKVLSDICNIYVVLNIDISNGMYLSDCLNHIKATVSNKRLKIAIDELIQNISNRNTTVDESLILFSNRFSLKEIETLSSCILEISKNGINDNYAKKISEESEQIILDINKKNADKINRYMSRLTIIFILYVIFLCVYWICINFNLSKLILIVS